MAQLPVQMAQTTAFVVVLAIAISFAATAIMDVDQCIATLKSNIVIIRALLAIQAVQWVHLFQVVIMHAMWPKINAIEHHVNKENKQAQIPMLNRSKV